jgi:hypothetical protein
MVSMCHLLFLTNNHEPLLHLLRAYHLLQTCEEVCLPLLLSPNRSASCAMYKSSLLGTIPLRSGDVRRGSDQHDAGMSRMCSCSAAVEQEQSYQESNA